MKTYYKVHGHAMPNKITRATPIALIVSAKSVGAAVAKFNKSSYRAADPARVFPMAPDQVQSVRSNPLQRI